MRVSDDDEDKIDYWPFTEDAVESVVAQMVNITPRDLVNTMQQLLEEVRLIDHDLDTGPITREIIDDSYLLEDILGV